MLGSTRKVVTKSRSKYSKDDYVSVLNVYDDNNVFDWQQAEPLGEVTTDDFIEEIRYDYGADVYFKNCVHVRNRFRMTGFEAESVLRKSNPPAPGHLSELIGYRGAVGMNKVLQYPYGVPAVDVGHVSVTALEAYAAPLSDIELENLLLDGLKEMIPKISQETDKFSLLNFLYELRETKDLFKVWSADKSLRANLAGLTLNLELGWKPFIGDCERIFNSVLTLQDHINTWNADAKSGKIYTHHANLSKKVGIDRPDLQQTINRSVTQAEWENDAYYDGVSTSQVHWYEEYGREDVDFRVHLMYKPKHINSQFIEDYIATVYDGLGLGQGASIIWNAIPFSFVIDWFYGFGDFLEQFEVTTTQVKFETVDFGYSIKRNLKKTYTPHLGAGGQNGKIYSNLGVCVLDRSTYIRRRAIPPYHRLGEIDYSPLWELSVPSWKQLWVGTNLAVALTG